MQNSLKEGRKERKKAYIEVIDVVMLSIAMRMEEPLLPLPGGGGDRCYGNNQS